MKKRLLAALLLLCMLSGALAEETPRPLAVQVNGLGYTFQGLKRILRVELFCAALDCAGRGYGIDITEPLTIEDVLDKTVFALEDGLNIRQLAKEARITLEEQDKERARQLGRERWENYRAVVSSEQAAVFLPAIAYEPGATPAETITRYLNAFGLTEEYLIAQARDEILEEKLKANYLQGREGTEEELLMAYIDWQLDALNRALVEEDAAALSELQRTVWED